MIFFCDAFWASIEGGSFGDNFVAVGSLNVEDGEFGSLEFSGGRLMFENGSVLGKLTSASWYSASEISNAMLGSLEVDEMGAMFSGFVYEDTTVLSGSKIKVVNGIGQGALIVEPDAEAVLVNGRFDDGLVSFGRSLIQSGMVFPGDLDLHADSLTRIEGGLLMGQLNSRSNACITILGGSFDGAIKAHPLSNFRLIAEELRIVETDSGSLIEDLTTELQGLKPGHSIELSQRDVTIEGVFRDGTGFSFELNSSNNPGKDYFDPQSILRVANPSTNPLAAFPIDHFLIFRGSYLDGDLSDLHASDDSHYVLKEGYSVSGLDDPIWLVFDGTVPATIANLFQFGIESRSNTPFHGRQVEFWNEFTRSYELIEERTEEHYPIDQIHMVDLPNQLNQYVDSNNGIKVRVGWRKSGFNLVAPRMLYIDHVFFNGSFEILPDDPIDLCHQW